MTLSPDLKSALGLITKALGGDTTGPLWFKPTQAESDTFAAAHGISATDIGGYPGTGPNTAQKPITPLSDTNDEAADLSYASFGYRANGKRWTWTAQGLLEARKTCGELAACNSPQEADTVIEGAGKVQPIVAQYLVMTYCIYNDTPFSSAKLLTGTLDGGSTVAQAAAFAAAEPGVPGPGI